MHQGSRARESLAVLALAALFATASAAQDAPAPADASEPIEQIVITAERRESMVQETPIALSAFDADSLREQGSIAAA